QALHPCFPLFRLCWVPCGADTSPEAEKSKRLRRKSLFPCRPAVMRRPLFRVRRVRNRLLWSVRQSRSLTRIFPIVLRLVHFSENSHVPAIDDLAAVRAAILVSALFGAQRHFSEERAGHSHSLPHRDRAEWRPRHASRRCSRRAVPPSVGARR